MVKHGRPPKYFVRFRLELLGEAIRSHVHGHLGHGVGLAGLDKEQVVGRKVGVLESNGDLLSGPHGEGLDVVDELFLDA